MRDTRVTTCASCRRKCAWLFYRKQDAHLFRTCRSLVGRGLCSTCYQRAWREGTLIDWPLTTNPAREILDDWASLRDDGYTWRQAAPRLGMTPAALDRALARAKRRGDHRGSRIPFAHDMRQKEAAA